MAGAQDRGIAHRHTDELEVPKPVAGSGTDARRRGLADSAPMQDGIDRESARLHYDDDDLLTVAEAARQARRSVRTLRRAYLSGRLIAHRDGNGRGVTIRYGDLRAWLTARSIRGAGPATPARAIARADVRPPVDTGVLTGNLELLTAALQPRRRRARIVSRPAAKRAAAARR